MQRKEKSITKSRLFLYALLASTFIQPAQGMMEEEPAPNWAKVFYKPLHDNFILGERVSLYLDECSLGRAAQVNQEWQGHVQKRRILDNPCLYTLPKSLISPQGALNKNIFKSLGATQDIYSPFIHKVRKLCETLDFKQQRIITNKFPNLLNPSLSLYPWHLLREQEALKVASSHDLSEAHPGFKRLIQVKETFQTLAQSFPSLRDVLEALKASYEGYIKSICTSAPQAREIFISPVFLQGPFLKGAYLIPQSITYKLLSMGDLGIPEKKNPAGSSIVSHVEKLYAKQNLIRKRAHEKSPTGALLKRTILNGTLDPGMEWAMSSFHTLLFGEGLVSSSLILLSSVPVKNALSQEKQSEERRLVEEARDFNTAQLDKINIINRLQEDESFKSTKTYTLQATPEVEGEFLGTFLERALQNPDLFNELDKSQVQGLILSAMLTHPADAKGDNFIVTNPDAQGKRHIIGIDNDLSLASLIIEQAPNVHALEARHLLFCIPFLMNQEIERDVSQQFLSHNPTLFLLGWLKSLKAHNSQIERLQEIITPETAALLRLPLKLKKGTGEDLLKRWTHLKTFLGRSLSRNPSSPPTFHDLFSAVSPLGALYYETLLNLEDCPLKAFNKAYLQGPFESVLSPTEQTRIAGALRQETSQPNAYKEREQDLEEIAQELLQSTNFLDLSDQDQKPIFEEASHSFPQAFKSFLECLPKNAFQKVCNVLRHKPSDSLREAILDFFPQKLKTPHRLEWVKFALQTYDHPLLEGLLKRQVIDPQNSKDLLLFALKNKSTPILIKALLDAGWDASIRDSQTRSNVIHYAVTYGMQNSFHENPLNEHPVKAYPKETLERLLKGTLNSATTLDLLNGKDVSGSTPLDLVMKKGIHQQDTLTNFVHLIELGAHVCNADKAYYFYKKNLLNIKKENLPPEFTKTFARLMNCNQELQWNISRFHMLPQFTQSPGYKITTSTSGEITILQEIVNQIMDAKGKPIRVTTFGNHDVARAEFFTPFMTHQLYFKFLPDLPGMEEAVGGLTRSLLGFGAPYTELIEINGSPVMVSEGIKGRNLLDVLRNEPKLLEQIDLESVSGLILSAMLINPEDGKPENYILEEHPLRPGKYRIVGIDNDHAFVPAIAREDEENTPVVPGQVKVVVQVKSILYCLDQMNDFIPKSVIENFLKMDSYAIIEKWLHNLKIIEKSYASLFENTINNDGFFKNNENCYLKIPFRYEGIRDFHEKFVHLQGILEQNSSIKHIDLLEKLEHRLSMRYESVLKCKNVSIYERFKNVDGPFYVIQQDGSSKTITKSGRIVEVHLPANQTIMEKIFSKGVHNLKSALIELEKSQQDVEEASLKSFFNQLSTHHNQLITPQDLAKEITRDIVLKQADFSQYTTPEQKAFLSFLQRYQRLHNLTLLKCNALTSDYLTKLSLANLQFLDLRECKNVNNACLMILAHQAPELKELNLGNISTLIGIGQESVLGFLTGQPLEFKVLQMLILSGCTGLKQFYLKAPNLQNLNIENCSQLNDQILDGVIEESKSLRKLCLTGANKISQAFLREELPFYPLKVLNLDVERQFNFGCDFIIHEKYRESLEENGESSTFPKDYKKSLPWFRLAAIRNYAPAQVNLGLLYAKGKGTSKNYEKALEWFHMAANQGHPSAQLNIGVMYYNGWGVKEDRMEAENWFRLAAKHGDSLAKRKLELLHQDIKDYTVYGKYIHYIYSQELNTYVYSYDYNNHQKYKEFHKDTFMAEQRISLDFFEVFEGNIKDLVETLEMREWMCLAADLGHTNISLKY